MKNSTRLMTLYRTSIDGDWKQIAYTAPLAPGGLEDGNAAARLTLLLQRRLGLGSGAARQLVASLYSRTSGVS